MIKTLILSKSKGVSLVVLLVVIGVGIIAILTVIILVAVNPSKQSQQIVDTQSQQDLENQRSGRDARRESDVTAIANAVHQYATENGNNLPSTITTTATEIGSEAGQIDLCAILTPTYIVAMPDDPLIGSYTSCMNYSTGYTIKKDFSGRVTVSAIPESRTTISVTR